MSYDVVCKLGNACWGETYTEQPFASFRVQSLQSQVNMRKLIFKRVRHKAKRWPFVQEAGMMLMSFGSLPAS